jgi:hypothetical protein
VWTTWIRFVKVASTSTRPGLGLTPRMIPTGRSAQDSAHGIDILVISHNFRPVWLRIWLPSHPVADFEEFTHHAQLLVLTAQAPQRLALLRGEIAASAALTQNRRLAQSLASRLRH